MKAATTTNLHTTQRPTKQHEVGRTGRETLYGTTWNSSITAVVPLTLALKGLTCSVQARALVDVNQPLPWFFTRWPREA